MVGPPSEELYCFYAMKPWIQWLESLGSTSDVRLFGAYPFVVFNHQHAAEDSTLVPGRLSCI